MEHTRRWTVQVFIFEHGDGSTRAEARLQANDHTHVTGTGVARKSPHDVDVPEIGDELAAARALAELSRRLLRGAAEDIEGMTARPVRLDS